MAKIRRVLEHLHEIFRAASHHQVLLESKFGAESGIACTDSTLKNALMELFILKWEIIFSDSKMQRHRVWQFHGFSDAFHKKIGDNIEQFDRYSKNIKAIRDKVVAHSDLREAVEALAEQGGHWPNLAAGVEYACLAYDVLTGETDAADHYRRLVIASRASFGV